MKSLFRGYIRFTDAEFKELWQTAHFSFDTNVLLNAYRLNKAAAEAFLGELKHRKGRLWLTYQVAEEFFRNYNTTVQTQLAVYGRVEKYLDGLVNGFTDLVDDHPHIPVEQFKKKFAEVANELKGSLKTARESHTDPMNHDPTLSTLLDLFDGNVRTKPNEKELSDWCADAEKRYAKKVPPGFADAKLKKDERKYGDAVLWFQLLDYAKEQKKPIIFVTDDAKEDWWLREHGKTLGPRPELIQEMFDTAGVNFYAYPMHRFVEEAAKERGETTSTRVIQEIEKVEQLNAAPPDGGASIDRVYSNINSFFAAGLPRDGPVGSPSQLIAELRQMYGVAKRKIDRATEILRREHLMADDVTTSELAASLTTYLGFSHWRIVVDVLSLAHEELPHLLPSDQDEVRYCMEQLHEMLDSREFLAHQYQLLLSKTKV